MEEVVGVDMDLASDEALEQEEDASNISDQVDDDLLESIWNELDGTVGRENIKRAIREAKAKYQHAHIKIYVPILMRRDVLDNLRPEPAESSRTIQ